MPERNKSATSGSGSSNSSSSANADRLTKLTLDLGSEQFDLVGLNASEGLSQPFFIVIDVISKLGSFDLLPHLGKPATVESLADGSHMRYFHGIITDGQLVGEAATGIGRSGEGEYHYRLTLQPMAHLHEHGRDFRIYQDQTALAIIVDVFNRNKIDFDKKLRGQAPNRVLKYCVQFGESDMAFASRLMEEHGIYYFYRHEQAKHVLVMCDDPAAHTAISCDHLDYNTESGSVGNSVSGGRGDGTQTATGWQEFLRSGAEKHAELRDYDFTRPTTRIEGKASGDKQHDAEDIQIYDWPGRFYDGSQGTNLAKILLESRRAQRISYQASTGCTEVVVGSTFALAKHPTGRFNAKYLVIAAHTTLAPEGLASGGSGGETEVAFTAIPAETHFRAPLITPRPIARGPETAVVVGPAGEEIEVDKYGRVRVQFHWDRLGKADEHSSCWIRVSQTGGLGDIIIPRIGHEVLVDFINGDPDRPIVVGRVFNEDHMPVYALPEHKTRALLRTKTYKRTQSTTPGDAKRFEDANPAANEIRFEDKTDNEEIYLHAEKDMNTVVRYCETRKVGKDEVLEVGNNQMITVYNDRTEEVKGNEQITIQKNRTEEVKADEKITVYGERNTTIEKDDTTTIHGDLTINVTKGIVITANTKILLRIGASSIEMTQNAIKISTPTFSAEAQATAKLSGNAMTSVESSGVVKVQGTIVKIN